MTCNTFNLSETRSFPGDDDSSRYLLGYDVNVSEYHAASIFTLKMQTAKFSETLTSVLQCDLRILFSRNVNINGFHTSQHQYLCSLNHEMNL